MAEQRASWCRHREGQAGATRFAAGRLRRSDCRQAEVRRARSVFVRHRGVPPHRWARRGRLLLLVRLAGDGERTCCNTHSDGPARSGGDAAANSHTHPFTVARPYLNASLGALRRPDSDAIARSHSDAHAGLATTAALRRLARLGAWVERAAGGCCTRREPPGLRGRAGRVGRPAEGRRVRLRSRVRGASRDSRVPRRRAPAPRRERPGAALRHHVDDMAASPARVAC